MLSDIVKSIEVSPIALNSNFFWVDDLVVEETKVSLPSSDTSNVSSVSSQYSSPSPSPPDLVFTFFFESPDFLVKVFYFVPDFVADLVEETTFFYGFF